MKEPISCSLTGNHWWKPFLGFLILSVVIMVPLENASKSIQTIFTPRVFFSSALFILVLSLILSLLQAAFFIIFSRIAFPTISFKRKTFSFTGSSNEFVFLTLVGNLLTMVTLGFYLPWYYSRITHYYVSHCVYDGKPARFEGTPGKLFKYFVLGFVIPMFLWVFIYVFVVAISINYQGSMSPDLASSLTVLSSVIYMLLFLLLVPFMYYLYKWFINISWENIHVYWKTEFWGSFFFILGQVFLIVLTVGIYLPAGILAITKYFVDRTVIDRDGQPAGKLVFTQEAGGFWFLWKQFLLSLVTLGIYLPWAYANTIRFLLSQVAVEDTPAELPQNY